MDVILKKDFPQLGFTGDKAVVRAGFARNFLIPNGIAVEINKRNEKFLRNQLQFIEAQKNKLKKEAEELAEKLIAETFQFKLKIGEKGKSFGSLTARDLYNELLARGYDIDRNQIVLAESAKSGGKFNFKAKLHSEVSVEVPFEVIAEVVGKKAKVQGTGETDTAIEDNSSSDEEE